MKISITLWKLNYNITIHKFFKVEDMRNKVFDIMKGILIILVVYGHCGLPLNHFIYLFHVPVFFMISGYYIKPEYFENRISVREYFYKKIKSLWLPYFLFNGIGCLLNNFFVYIHFLKETDKKNVESIGIDILKTFLFRGGAKNIGGATWFLRTLFEVSIIFIICGYLFRWFRNSSLYLQIKTKIGSDWLYYLDFIVLSFLFFLLILFGEYLCPHIDDCLKISFILPLIYLGYVIKQLKISDMINKPQISCIVLFCSLLLLIILNHLGTIELAKNEITNSIFFLFCCIFGWCFIYSLSWLINHIPILSNILAFIGESSLSIMLFHFLLFKFVNLFIVTIQNLSYVDISAFPTLKGNSLWGILYIVVGVVVPCLLYQMKKKIMRKIK